MPEAGVKYDVEKPRWDLLHLALLEGAVRVLGYGARKYSDDNWVRVPDGRRRYYAAMMRHLTAWQAGEELDPESGESHLDHAICSILFLKHFDRKKENV